MEFTQKGNFERKNVTKIATFFEGLVSRKLTSDITTKQLFIRQKIL